jgi:tRNA-specific 2-thiouridylase
VGEHEGLCFYTLGQRKGLGLGGEGEAWFVVDKVMETSTLKVVRGETHPSLYRWDLSGTEMNWLVSKEKLFANIEESELECEARVRYRQKKVKAFVKLVGEGIDVRFDYPLKAITPGQFVVLYKSGICLGSAYIKSVGPTLKELGQILPQVKNA